MTLASSKKVQRILGWDRYEVLEQIGSGSAADVFRVRDRRSGGVRAAKVLTPENASNPKILARFEDEFRILRTLHHPHLAEVYDYGWTEEGGRFLIMELVDGVPLDEFFRANPSDIWAILYELCETLTFVHNHKLLHQDIKPSNILVKRTTAFGPDLPLVKLIDFGLMYKRDAGAAVELVGTPEYVAPEVIRGEASLTRAVDYYSLGATLFELLVGRPPFVGSSSEVLRAHLEREPVIEEEELEWAELYPHVCALLTKDRKARLEAFEELRRAVVSRLTGGIEELDRAYGLARIDSLPMIGKGEAWGEMMTWLGEVREAERHKPTLRIEGEPGSGIGFMIDALCAEAAIVQTAVVRLGARAESRRLVREMQLSSVRGTSLLVCVDCNTVDEREIAFARYVEALGDAVSNISTGLILHGELQSPEAVSISEGARAIYVDALVRRDYEQVVDLFRGSTTAEDIRLIGDTLAHAKTSGGVVDLLRTAMEGNALAFGGGRWAVRRDIPRTIAPRARKDDSNAEAILASLSPSQLRLMTCISCADYPIPVSWLPSILKMKEGLVESDLQALVIRRLVSVGDKDGSRSVSPSSALLGEAARRAGRNKTDQFHGALAYRLEFEGGLKEQSVLRLLSLASHYEQLGNYRELARSHPRAIHILTTTGVPGDADREYERGLKWFARPEAETYYPGAQAIHRFYVKRYLNSLWSRNLHARVHRLIRDTYVDRRVPVPRSFWPKYVRSTLDVEGPTTARTLLNGLSIAGLSETHELRLLMNLEGALVDFQDGKHRRGLTTINGLESYEARFPQRHRHRLLIYKAMCLDALGKPAEAERLLRRELPRATADGSIDEAVLIQAFGASIAIQRGDTAKALRQIARALRIASKNRLYLRANLLYRLAASSYWDMGRFHRAIRSQMRAIQSAYALDLMDFVAMGWQRLAEYECAMGMLGNAIRYVERAEALLPKSGFETHWSQLHCLQYELSVEVCASNRHDFARASRSWKRVAASVGTRGYFEAIDGHYDRTENRLVLASSHFARARSLFVRAEALDSAVAAAAAEVRTLYELGRGDLARGPAGFISSSVKASSSITLKAERCIVELRTAYISRAGRRHIIRLALRASEVWGALESSRKRAEIALLLFRLFARRGMLDEARRWLDLYAAEVRKMLANLEDPTHVEGVARIVGMDVVPSETAAAMRRLAGKRENGPKDDNPTWTRSGGNETSSR